MSSSSITGSLFTPLQFTGISQYSSDFQSILTRAVKIAQLPAQALQQQEAQITQRETDLSTLGADVSGVQSALVALGKLGSGQALAAISSNTSVVTATNSGATQGAAYNISSVTSLASAASELSSSSYGDATTKAVSASGNLNLIVGSNQYSISLAAADNNLQGLAGAINELAAGVSASIITTRSGDYLSVSANSPGATTLRLMKDPATANTNILTSSNQGSNTVFTLDNVTISEPSTTVNNVIPGVTLKFSGTSSSATTVSVATDRTGIQSALQQLVSSYNTLSAANEQQVGKTGGSLAGNNIVYQIRSALTSIVQYQGTSSSGVNSLANLGIEIGDSGQMSLNTNTLNSLSDSQISSALSLLGSATTGIGGLQQTFAQITDSTTGTIATQENQWSRTVTNLSNQLTTMTSRINSMEQTLNQQLQAADASVAELTSQQNELTASITSLNFTSYGYNRTIASTQGG